MRASHEVKNNQNLDSKEVTFSLQNTISPDRPLMLSIDLVSPYRMLRTTIDVNYYEFLGDIFSWLTHFIVGN